MEILQSLGLGFLIGVFAMLVLYALGYRLVKQRKATVYDDADLKQVYLDDGTPARGLWRRVKPAKETCPLTPAEAHELFSLAMTAGPKPDEIDPEHPLATGILKLGWFQAPDGYSEGSEEE